MHFWDMIILEDSELRNWEVPVTLYSNARGYKTCYMNFMFPFD